MSSPFTQVPKPKRTNQGKKMAALIEEEGLDEDGHHMKCGNLHHQQKRKSGKPRRSHKERTRMRMMMKMVTFRTPALGMNQAQNLTPSTKRNKSTTRAQQIKSASASSKAKSMTHAKKKLQKAMVEEVEVEDSP
ncbi:hypothetical protein JB92DRAFT_2829558 [Gautieria morchelliformis]|nr:hypothetical protein JB92DRAFT_2829558 [Gautieria morchelliformis]